MKIASIPDYLSALIRGQPSIGIQDFELRPPLRSELLSQALDGLPLSNKLAKLVFGDFDGQKNSGLKLFCEFSLLSSGGCAEIYNDMIGFTDLERGGPSDPRIKNDLVWRKGWIPFAWNQNTNKHLCIDLDPASAGIAGQVIFVGEWGELSVHGDSFLDFLTLNNHKLSSTNYELYNGVWNEFKGLIIPTN